MLVQDYYGTWRDNKPERPDTWHAQVFARATHAGSEEECIFRDQCLFRAKDHEELYLRLRWFRLITRVHLERKGHIATEIVISALPQIGSAIKGVPNGLLMSGRDRIILTWQRDKEMLIEHKPIPNIFP